MRKWMIRVIPVAVWLLLVLIPNRSMAEGGHGPGGIGRAKAEGATSTGLYGQSNPCGVGGSPAYGGATGSTAPEPLASAPQPTTPTGAGLNKTGPQGNAPAGGTASTGSTPPIDSGPKESEDKKANDKKVAATKPSGKEDEKSSEDKGGKKPDGGDAKPSGGNASEVAKGAFKANCLGCHDSSGSPVLFKSDGSLAAGASASGIKGRVDAQDGPPGMQAAIKRLSKDEKTAIGEWASSR